MVARSLSILIVFGDVFYGDCAMTDPVSLGEADFDAYAAEYDRALNQGIAVSGEDKYYFARGRIAWLAKCLGEHPKTVVDYGCGTGASIPYLLDLLGADEVTGLDVSEKVLQEADRRHGTARARFATLEEYHPSGQADLVFCNGVFHHIPPDRRAGAIEYVRSSLRPGGLLALWENNPWNPGTRLVMSRIPFDRDAITLSPPAARRMMRAGGFEVMRTDFLFIFPKPLAGLRLLEPSLAKLPFGAQYMVMGRR